MKDDGFYREIIKRSPYSYFYGQLIIDLNNAVDFLILDVNPCFEHIIGINDKSILGNRISRILPDFFNESTKQLFVLSDKREYRSSGEGEQYIRSLNAWFKIYVFNYKEDYFVVQLVEIHKEEKFMKVLTDNLPFAAWAKNKKGQYIAINKKYEEDIGYSFNDIYGKTDFDIWQVELANQYRDEDLEVMKKKSVKHIVDLYIDNTWYETYKAPVYDEMGCIVGTIGFSINTSEVKKAKKELEKRNKFLKVLIDAIPDFISYKSLEGTYSMLNKSIISKYYGQKEEELVGKNYKEIISDSECLAKAVLQDSEIIDEGRIKIFEESLKLVDGSVKNYETIKVPCFEDSNVPAGILSISRDITERITADKKLKESEEKFRQLVENIDGMYLIREGKKMTYVSPGYEKIFGRSCDSLYENSNSFFEAIHPEDITKYTGSGNKLLRYENFDEMLKAKNKEYIEEIFRVIRPGGAIRWLWTKSFPVKDEKGEIIRRLIIGQDITEIKEAEGRIEKLRTEFFANLSHEFRTPLNMVFSSLQMIELKLKGNVYENAASIERYINVVKQNSFRLLRLTNNLIDTTKIDAGYFEYFPENQDIVKYVKNIADSVKDFVKNKEIEFVFNSEVKAKTIAFDLDKIERIVLNLLSNAIKFNKPRGKIEVSISAEDKYVHIHVKDTGIGIPCDKKSDIFERFKQVSDRLTKVCEGSGIGLSLVKSLVEMHGGTISVKSDIGKGTEFIVSLPDVRLVGSGKASSNKNQIMSNSRVERIQIEFSDIYGFNL